MIKYDYGIQVSILAHPQLATQLNPELGKLSPSLSQYITILFDFKEESSVHLQLSTG
jgi:hypothetical protein